MISKFMKNVVSPSCDAAFIGGIGVSVSKSELSVLDYSRNMYPFRFF